MSNPVWNHIGLHNHAVGTFTCESDKIVWKSAGDHSASKSISAATLTGMQWTVVGKTGYLRLQTSDAAKHELRFDGFPANDFEALKSAIQRLYNVTVEPLALSSAGAQYGLTAVKGKNLVFRHCVLDEMNEEGQEFEPRAEDEFMSMDLAQVTQCVLPGNNRNEIEVQFPESDAVETGTDQLVSIRLYIPPDAEADPADKEASTSAEMLQQKIMQTANIRKTTGDVIVQFPLEKGTFLTPRGRYGLELYDYFLRMRGQKYDYKIKYDDISRLYLLPKPDEVHMAFCIALDKPIRQGQQRYQYLVLQCTKDNDQMQINMEEEALKEQYEDQLKPIMQGPFSNLIAKTFKVITGKKVFIPGKFANANQQACVKCALRANEGLLYPLEKQFIFIHKPTVLIRFNEIDSVEFQRYGGGAVSTRNFDLCVNLKQSVTGGANKDYTFSGIDRSDYTGLYNFLNSKKITIKNLQSDLDDAARGPPTYNENELLGIDDGPEDEDSEDDDFDEEAAQQAEEKGSDSDDSMDDDELGSEVDSDLDSDIEEAGKAAKKQMKSAEANDADHSDGDEEEEDKPIKKRKSDHDAKRAKRAKKDPNAPKRTKTAYMYFMDKNRARIKDENPDASFGEIGKLAGTAWKAMSREDKEQYEDMAKADKERYQNEMKDYMPPVGSASPTTTSLKKGKKKKDPNAPKRSTTAFMLFSTAMRPQVKSENPDLSFGELGKKMGELYRALGAEERAKYDKLAMVDKERYKKEMAAYEAKQKGEEVASDNDSDDDEEEEEAEEKKQVAADSDDDGVNEDDALPDSDDSDDE